MNKSAYERECIVRGPRFRRDLQRLSRKHPRLFNPDRWPRDDQGRPVGFLATDAEQKALRAFEAKYLAVTSDRVFMVLQPWPLVFDPPWKLCADRATVEFLSRRGRAPKGVVTRAGAESDGDLGFDSEKVHGTARRLFDRMDEGSRTFDRRAYGPVIFAEARLFLPIRSETTLDHVQQMWPAIKRAQRACYGLPAAGRATRRNIYQERISAFDLVRAQGLTVEQAARWAGMKPWTLWRRFREAVRDIEGVTRQLGPEEYVNHVAVCRRCREAEAKAKSDL